MSRFNLQKHFSSLQPLFALSKQLHEGTLEPKLCNLVLMRASQLNGCAYCLDMHVRDLRKQGEEWQRINSLATWREVGFFNERERAALAWAESLTRLADRYDARDAEFAALKANFSDLEIAELSVAVAQINTWNRLNVASGIPVAVKPLL